MYGLKMKKEYLLDILSGKKKTDVRTYNAPINGVIALIDSKSGKVYGYATITNSRFITYKEYVLWHVNDNFSMDKALNYYDLSFETNAFRLYYEYIFEDVKIEKNKYKPVIISKRYSWVEIED